MKNFKAFKDMTLEELKTDIMQKARANGAYWMPRDGAHGILAVAFADLLVEGRLKANGVDPNGYGVYIPNDHTQNLR